MVSSNLRPNRRSAKLQDLPDYPTKAAEAHSLAQVTGVSQTPPGKPAALAERAGSGSPNSEWPGKSTLTHKTPLA